MDADTVVKQFGQRPLSIKSVWFGGVMLGTEDDELDVVVSPYTQEFRLDDGVTLEELVRMDGSVYAMVDTEGVKWESEMSMRAPFRPVVYPGGISGPSTSSPRFVPAVRSVG